METWTYTIKGVVLESYKDKWLEVRPDPNSTTGTIAIIKGKDEQQARHRLYKELQTGVFAGHDCAACYRECAGSKGQFMDLRAGDWITERDYVKMIGHVWNTLERLAHDPADDEHRAEVQTLYRLTHSIWEHSDYLKEPTLDDFIQDYSYTAEQARS